MLGEAAPPIAPRRMAFGGAARRIDHLQSTLKLSWNAVSSPLLLKVT